MRVGAIYLEHIGKQDKRSNSPVGQVILYIYVCNGLKHNFLASNRATPHQRNIRVCNAIFKYTLMQCSIQLTSCPFVHSSGCIPQIYGIAGECNTLASLNHPNIIGCLGLF